MRWLCRIGVTVAMPMALLALGAQPLAATQTAPDGEVHVEIGAVRGACTLTVNGARADFAQLGAMAKRWAEDGLTIRLVIGTVPDRCGIQLNSAFTPAGFELNTNTVYIPNRVVTLAVPVQGEIKLAAPCTLTVNGAAATFDQLAALAPRWNRQVVEVHFEPLAGAQPDCAERVRKTLQSGGLGNWSGDAPGGIETFESGDAM
jgi:hypothetical protein